MGLSCSKQEQAADVLDAVPDPDMYSFWKRSVELANSSHSQRQNYYSDNNRPATAGQSHLLYKHQGGSSVNKMSDKNSSSTLRAAKGGNAHSSESKHQTDKENPYPTRLLIRRHQVRSSEEGVSGTHIYACRWTADQEQCPPSTTTTSSTAAGHQESAPTSSAATTTSAPANMTISEPPAILPSKTASAKKNKTATTSSTEHISSSLGVDHLFAPSTMAAPPTRKVTDWVTVSEENRIYIADTGLSVLETDHIIAVTEQACKGQYAAYTYAKQTLGCREYPALAAAVHLAVHTVVTAIVENDQQHNDKLQRPQRQLALDDREPHMVKYDVTRKERQKLDMHTDKSEWTFLIALSNGCGLDYSGGGTYFECLDSTVHVQRGHCLIFPGKLRHCGQRITSGLRFLLVGFLVDKATNSGNSDNSKQTAAAAAATAEDDNDAKLQLSGASNIP